MELNDKQKEVLRKLWQNYEGKDAISKLIFLAVSESNVAITAPELVNVYKFIDSVLANEKPEEVGKNINQHI